MKPPVTESGRDRESDQAPDATARRRLEGPDAGARILADRARSAPGSPGVYCFLGDGGELLYVGKATNLRRRLVGHTRGGEPRRAAFASALRDVRWFTCADEQEALCREADIIVALVPMFNAAMTTDAFTFIGLDVGADGSRVGFRLTEHTSPTNAGMYGGFAHLGKGKASWPSIRTNAGYSALLRLLWVSFARDASARVPARLRGKSPPVAHEAPFDPDTIPALRDFLSGRSSRLLAVLRDRTASGDVPAFMRAPVDADLEAADEFFRLGPRALRRLRRGSGAGTGPIDRTTFAKLIADDLASRIGAFRVPASPGTERLVGRRTSRSMHFADVRRERDADR